MVGPKSEHLENLREFAEESGILGLDANYRLHLFSIGLAVAEVEELMDYWWRLRSLRLPITVGNMVWVGGFEEYPSTLPGFQLLMKYEQEKFEDVDEV